MPLLRGKSTYPSRSDFRNLLYINLVEVRDGLIVRWEVRNDSGERLLQRHGIDA